MTDPTAADTSDLLARADTWDASYYPGELIEDLAAALRASDRDLVTARAVVRHVLELSDEPLGDAERAWLASVSPPTSRDDQ